MCPALLWQQNESGDTALHIAARYGRAGIVIALIQAIKTYYPGNLEQGCAITSGDAPSQEQKLIRKTNNKDTTLHEVVRFNYFGVVKRTTSCSAVSFFLLVFLMSFCSYEGASDELLLLRGGIS
ncbi:hypothetical protein ACFX14_025883 [Malus domestica]